MPGYACTTGRHASGIEAVSSLTGVTNWRQQHRMQIPQQEFGGAAMRTGQRIKASPSWGTPVGRQEFVESELAKIVANFTGSCSQVIPVQDLQCCVAIAGTARANFYIRTIRPELSAEFSQRHDEQIWHCFCKLLKTPPGAVAVSARKAATLLLTSGGLGLRSAWRLREAAHWASWADTIKMVKASHPDIAETILAAVEARDEVPSVQAINQSVESVAEVGFDAPPWEELAREIVVPPNAEDADPHQPRVGWQASASRLVESSFLEALRPTLSDAEGALLRSQGGPLASAPFVSFPTSRFARLEPQVLRVLFLRRLRLPPPLTARGLPMWPSSRRPGVPSGERGCENLSGAAKPRSAVVSGLQDVGKRRVTQSWLATEAGLVWLCSRERLEDASPRKLPRSSEDWRQRKCVMCPSCCRDAPAQWLRR